MIDQLAQQDIHIFTANGRRLAFNGNNYNVALLDDAGASLLAQRAAGRPGDDAAPVAGDEIGRFLAPPAPLHSRQCDDGATPEVRGSPDILCLLVTSKCNLRCDYCFNSQGSYSFLPDQVMDEGTARNAIDLLLSGCGDQPAVSFFGGEPTTEFPLIRRVVEYCETSTRGKTPVSFHMATNATLVTRETARFLKQHDFSLIVSLDGDGPAHDYHRKFPSGRGTFRAALKGVEAILDAYGSQERIVFRGTFTHQQKAFGDSFEQLVRRGFEHISIEPATGTDEDAHAVRLSDVPSLAAEYSRLIDSYWSARATRPNLSFFHITGLAKDLAQCRQRNRPCGAANGYMAVAPDGDIYPCHRIVHPHYRLGNVNEEARRRSLNAPLQREFHSATVANRPACRACWARYLCGGTCYARNIDGGDDILATHGTDCALFRTRAELAIELYVRTELSRCHRDFDAVLGAEHAKMFDPESLSPSGSGMAQREGTCGKLCEIISCTSCQSSCTDSCTGSCTGSCTDNCTSSCTGGCTSIVMY